MSMGRIVAEAHLVAVPYTIGEDNLALFRGMTAETLAKGDFFAGHLAVNPFTRGLEH
jgi:hypothetical protein